MMEFDPKTRKWIQYNPNDGARICKCERCGSLYNMELGHKCMTTEELLKEYDFCMKLSEHYADSRDIKLCEKYKRKAEAIKRVIERG